MARTVRDRRNPLADVPSDDDIAQLVRELAEDWTLPPHRIDRPTWRDLIERGGGVSGVPRGRTRVRASGRTSPGAWLSALAAALVLAVAGAFLATQRPAAGPADRAPAEPLPTLDVRGSLPAGPLVVEGDTGYRLVDLDSGSISATPLSGWASGPRRLIRLADGSFVCACLEATTTSGTPPLTLRLRWFDRSLVERRSHDVATYDAESVALAPGPDDLLFVVAPAGLPGGGSSVDVVDLASGAVRQTIALDADPAALTGARVSASSAGTRLLITLDSEAGADHWIARLGASGVTAVTRLDRGACASIDDGFVDDETVFLVCAAEGASSAALRRIPLAGGDRPADVALPDLPLGTPVVDLLADPVGRRYFVWAPDARRVARIDMASGSIVTRDLPPTEPAAAEPDLAERLAAWLAPSVQAKPMAGAFGASLALAPDGETLYVTGWQIDAVVRTTVDAVDADELERRLTLEIPADVTAVALSSDGDFLYATGAPTPPPPTCGRSQALPCAPGQTPTTESGTEASLFVFDTASGERRLVAGRLGMTPLSLDRTLVP